MKCVSTPILVAVVLAAAASWAVANDIEPGKEYYSAIRAPQPIVIDGDLTEWQGAAILADPRFSIPKGSGDSGTLTFFELYDGGGPGTAVWTGPDDHTSAVQIVYDDDNVYFGFVVTDEYHENSANSAWNGDSVQLMIADETRTQQIALYNYALGGIEEAPGEVIVMHEAGPGGTEAAVVRNSETGRTIYEIKLPKESMALSALGGGVRFGLGMAINDGDQEAPGQQGWGGLGAHSIVFGKSPSETALVTLAQSNDIEPGKEIYTANPAPKPIELDGDLGEWSGVPVLSDPRFAIPKGSGRNGSTVLFELYDGGGPGTAVWTGPDDHTSAVQIVYDAENVYFGFVVTDEYHENSANSAWNGDSVQLMIADNNQSAQIALYNYALGGIEDALGGVIVMHEAGPGGTEAVVTRNSETKRTIYEIKLPASSLSLPDLPLGTQFGLGMAINDGDLEAPGQQGWGGLGAHALVFGKSPQQTALVTLGVGGTGADLMFLSAISTTLTGVSFRATDKGTSIVDPATAKLLVDGQAVPLTVRPKVLDATDFSYVRPTSFEPASDHTYAIEIKDTRGNVITSSGSFRTEYYAVLNSSMQAVSVDTTKRGFIWKVFQNETYAPNSLAETEMALAGQLEDPSGTPITENFAMPDRYGAALGEGVVDGPLIRYEIESVINLNQIEGLSPGNFPGDLQMPGIPGGTESTDGIHAEIITFVNLAAGWHQMGVNSDDGFRTQAGFIKVPSDGVLLGEFNGPRGSGDTNFRFFVQDAGIYPLRTIWQEGGGEASIEIYSILEDGSKVLLNDTDNGGLIAYRSGVAPDKGGQPVPANLNIQLVGNQIVLTWTNPALVLQQSSNLAAWTDLLQATSPYPVILSAETPALYFRLR